jgi:hypothetical protein
MKEIIVNLTYINQTPVYSEAKKWVSRWLGLDRFQCIVVSSYSSELILSKAMHYTD